MDSVLVRQRRQNVDTTSLSDQVWEHQSHRESILKEGKEKLTAQKRAIYLLLITNLIFACTLFLLHDFLSSIYRRNELYIFGFTRDFTAMKDYASTHSGGTVIYSLTTAVASEGMAPTAALDDGLHPGNCWRIGSSTGQLGVRFPHPIRITNITIDHVSKFLVSHVSDAPREIKVWGLRDKGNMDLPDATEKAYDNIPLPAITDDESYNLFFLFEAEYDPHKSMNIQTYNLPLANNNEMMDGIVLGILNNWGHTSTCLYRLRVHSVQ